MYCGEIPGHHVDGLVQDCSDSIANILQLLQSCTKPSMISAQLDSALSPPHNTTQCNTLLDMV